MFYTAVCGQIQCFRGGKIDTEDKHCAKRIITVSNEPTFLYVNKVTEEMSYVYVSEVCSTFDLSGEQKKILYSIKKKKKKIIIIQITRWIPDLDQMKQKILCSQGLFRMLVCGGSKRSCDVTTSDETCVSFHGIQNKRVSQLWAEESDRGQNIFRQVSGVIKDFSPHFVQL